MPRATNLDIYRYEWDRVTRAQKKADSRFDAAKYDSRCTGKRDIGGIFSTGNQARLVMLSS